MKLFIVRHGQTIENAKHIIMGQRGGTLSEKGVEQAQKTAEKLKKINFDQVWSSDLKRCVDTAKYILAYHPNLEAQTTKALREVNYGKFQGRPSAEIQPFFKQAKVFVTSKMPGGESHLAMFKRTIKFLNKLYRRYPEQTILIVTHTGPIEVIRASLEKASLDSLFPKDALHASIWELEIDEPLKVYPRIRKWRFQIN